MSLPGYAWAALAVGALMFALWLVSLRKRDVSIVDPWWSMAFLLVTVIAASRTELSLAKGVFLALVTLWALRLWAHLLWRSRGKPEDPRYAAFRERFGPERYPWLSLFQVFLLQGSLVLIIAVPLWRFLLSDEPMTLGAPQLVGAALFVVGFVLEAVADAQLQAFRAAPVRPAPVLDSGLWRYSRHPNYFGETVLWWGLWLFTQPYAGAWTIFAPAVVTFLLVRVSGVKLLDEHLAAKRPAYRDYIARTSAFVPWPPRSEPLG